MGRFDFGSPGAAFTETMAKVLAERKAEERQQMLDRLTQSAEERAGRAETRAMAAQEADNAWRTAQTKDMDIRRENEQFDTMVKFFDPNKSLKAQGATPEQVELFRKRGALRQRAKTNPQVSTSESFTPPAGEAFEGSPEPGPALSGEGGTETATAAPKPPPEMEDYFSGTVDFQNREKLKQSHGALLTALLTDEDKENDRIANFLAQRAATNEGIIPEEALALLQPNKPFYSYENETGDLIKHDGGIEYNAEVQTRTRPYRPPVNPRDRNIGTRNGFPVRETPDGKVEEYSPTKGGWVPLSGVLDGKDPNVREFNVPGQATDDLGEALMSMADDPGPEEVENYLFAANAAIESINASPKSRTLAQLYLRNPSAAEQAISSLNEQERVEFSRILNFIRAANYRQHLGQPKK